ncbi:flagellar type III secretion system protein FliR [Fulvimarina endophytica]|uniref:Flagellar type III secretion system protein FliR n=1 Tax=Fulvimarina endophytica TaxID=2293836 RepID=A0A371X075_9HYPH|nr:flagellar biosynthetic protein FliR [Fulvimarina endophytica]RFC62637.1 flagellar type III secretion system protein FliR [Fulvimarina endophytica]
MSDAASTIVFALFLVFCRIGTCLMLLPGFSSNRIPPQIRLFLAFAISLALAPVLLPVLRPLVEGASDAVRLKLMISEIMIGFFIGLLGRSFLIALSFFGHVVANAVGMGQQMGPVYEDAPDPVIGTMITLTATVLIFVTNLHAEIARALVASYTAMPASAGFGIQPSLISLTDNLDLAFVLCLRIASPFVLYAVIVNFAVGLANKLTPQIPIYFISLPFVLAGGLFLFGYVVGDFLIIFMNAFEDWVLAG